MALTLTLSPPSPAKVAPPLSFGNSFADSLGVLNCGLVADYLFGSAASGAAPVIPITSVADLTANFNPQADVSGTSVQVEAIERYQAFNATNHAFASDHLSLTAALEAGGNADVLQLVSNAPTTAATVLNFANTAGVQDGQIVAIAGAFTSSLARVVSHDATTVTIGQSVTIASGVTVYFLPAFVPSGAVAASNNAVQTYASVPAGVAAGMFYNNITAGTFGTRRVVSRTGTTITYDAPVSQAASDFCILSPPITSGQFWTKVGYQPGKNGANYIAMELTCQIPGNTKQGAWPAFWGYSRSSEGFSFDASEPDIFEFNMCATANASAYSGNIHGGWYQREDYKKFIGVHSSYWDASGFYRPSGAPDYSAAQHKFQFIWTSDRIYYFIDGILIKCQVWPWSSACTAQIGCNLGAGSFLPTYVSVLLFPLLTSQFPYSYDVYELKIWQG
jgi:hypothetical protein